MQKKDNLIYFKVYRAGLAEGNQYNKATHSFMICLKEEVITP